jgi:hypothetical protein
MPSELVLSKRTEVLCVTFHIPNKVMTISAALFMFEATSLAQLDECNF